MKPRICLLISSSGLSPGKISTDGQRFRSPDGGRFGGPNAYFYPSASGSMYHEGISCS
jgi:hypothetical protein